jgi:hypothetical protein
VLALHRWLWALQEVVWHMWWQCLQVCCLGPCRQGMQTDEVSWKQPHLLMAVHSPFLALLKRWMQAH